MKKLITILGLLLIPISFTNAGQVTTSFDIPDTLSISNSAILTFNNINFSSQFNAINMQNVFYVPTSANSYGGLRIGFLSRYEGKPYLYVGIRPNSSANLQVKQGFVTKACMTTAGSGLSCNGYNESNLTSFLNAGGFNHGSLSYSDHQRAYDYFMICFGNDINDYCFKANAYDDNSSGLTGSLGVMDYYPDDINLISWSSSPFSNTPTGPTYSEYACPTIQQLLNTYGEEYNTNLCYSSNIIDSGGTATTVTPKTIFQLYNTYTGLNEDLTNYNIFCNRESTKNICESIFENKKEQYTLIAKIPSNVQTTKLYQYCNLSLNYQPNQTTCTLSGGMIGLYTGVSINDIVSEIGKIDYTVITPGRPPESTGTGNGNGSVYDILLGDQEDDTQRRNVIQNAKNIIQTMKELYAKFTGIFRGRAGTQGVIPFYITGLMLLIVLFKLFKK